MSGPLGADFLWEGRSAPIGITTATRPEAALQLPPDAVLWWYTDGLIERRDESIDVGLERLANLIRRDPDQQVAHPCSDLVDTLTSGNPISDDIAVIRLQLHRFTPPTSTHATTQQPPAASTTQPPDTAPSRQPILYRSRGTRPRGD